MIARLQALTGLAFSADAVPSVAAKASIEGEVYDSTIGWPVDHMWPHLRKVLSVDAIIHGAFGSKADKAFEHINERVHWSALRKRGRPDIVFGVQTLSTILRTCRQIFPRSKSQRSRPRKKRPMGIS